VKVVNVARPHQPWEEAAWQVPSWAVADLAVAGPWLYVADADFGLRVVDASRTDRMVEAGRLEAPGIRALAVQADHPGLIYMIDERSVAVVDVRNAALPQILGRLPLHAEGQRIAPRLRDLAVSGGYILVAADHLGLWMVDASDPRRLQETSRLALPDTAQPDIADGIAVDGAHAFLASSSSNRIHAVDVSDASEPRRMGSLDVEWQPSGVAARDGHLYFGSNSPSALTIVDARDPAKMQVVGSRWTSGYVRSVVVDGDVAYVSSGDLLVMDVSRPDDPTLITSLEVPHGQWWVTSGGALALEGDRVYVADDLGTGVTVYRRSGELPSRSPSPPEATASPTATVTPRPSPTPDRLVPRLVLPWLDRASLPADR
jgi:hypothetical protein